MASLTHIHLRVNFAVRSPLVPSPSTHFDYFAVTGATPVIADVVGLATAVTASFNATPAGASAAPSKYLAGVISTGANASKWEAYTIPDALDHSPMGSPVAIGSWTASGILSAGGDPEGVAAVITLQAPYGTDVEFGVHTRPRARDRGRMYFGPLSIAYAMSSDVNNKTFIASACRTDLCKWIKAINNVSGLTTSGLTYQLGVWSRAGHFIKALSECWVDDRLDYERRRAGAASTKTVEPLP